MGTPQKTPQKTPQGTPQNSPPKTPHKQPPTNQCYVHKWMKTNHPGMVDKSPVRRCLLCSRVYCDAHKGEEDGVCECNHVTYYWNNYTNPNIQYKLFRSYEEWENFRNQSGEGASKEAESQEVPEASIQQPESPWKVGRNYQS